MVKSEIESAPMLAAPLLLRVHLLKRCHARSTGCDLSRYNPPPQNDSQPTNIVLFHYFWRDWMDHFNSIASLQSSNLAACSHWRWFRVLIPV